MGLRSWLFPRIPDYEAIAEPEPELEPEVIPSKIEFITLVDKEDIIYQINAELSSKNIWVIEKSTVGINLLAFPVALKDNHGKWWNVELTDERFRESSEYGVGGESTGKVSE